jgi:hypothetical protein
VGSAAVPYSLAECKRSFLPTPELRSPFVHT